MRLKDKLLGVKPSYVEVRCRVEGNDYSSILYFTQEDARKIWTFSKLVFHKEVL